MGDFFSPSWRFRAPPSGISECVGAPLLPHPPTPQNNNRWSVDATESGMQNRHAIYGRHAARTFSCLVTRRSGLTRTRQDTHTLTHKLVLHKYPGILSLTPQRTRSGALRVSCGRQPNWPGAWMEGVVKPVGGSLSAARRPPLIASCALYHLDKQDVLTSNWKSWSEIQFALKLSLIPTSNHYHEWLLELSVLWSDMSVY